jgi:heme-degrading monooxygenase HmoA
VTRWRDKASFDAWFNSQAFQHGHAQANAEGAAPVSVASEVWTYEVER